MKNKMFIIIIILIGLNSNICAQSLFRSGVFIHHSTGQNIWGAIPAEIAAYNTANGYTDSNAVSMSGSWFPTWDNAWADWHYIFDNSDPVHDMQPYYNNNKIIVIKSCFPSSAMEGVGSPSDTIVDPQNKTIYNYKWHWRSIIRIMEQHPDNFFAIWTNVPFVEQEATFQASLQAPGWSNWFSTWAKDTLATGLDATYGAFPPNVYVFNYFPLLVDENYYLDPAYAVSTTDSHPNETAAQIIAPLFVSEIFGAAIAYEAILPVELTLFDGNYEDGVVNLQWITATELNNFGFEVERRNDHSAYESIGFVNGNGTSANRVNYNFVDKNLSSNRYYYRLKQIDLDGSFEYSDEVEIKIDALSDFQLYQNYPNPFNPSTEIYYILAKSGNITLKVYNSLGSEVATLADGFMDSGKHSVKFNAKHLTSGIYYYRIKADNFTSTRKMLLIK